MIQEIHEKSKSKKMHIKLLTYKILLLTSLIALGASKPVGRSMPPELTATIEKKWPGSRTAAVLRTSTQPSTLNLYYILLNRDTVGWAYTRRVISCRNGGCDGKHIQTDELQLREYFDYYAITNKQYTVLEVKVFNYAATHGEEICSKAWLKQFRGYNGTKPLRYGKDIDAISGATISGKAITEDVELSIKQIGKRTP